MVVSTAEMPFLPGIVKIIYSYTGESPRVDSASHCVIIAPYIHLTIFICDSNMIEPGIVYNISLDNIFM